MPPLTYLHAAEADRRTAGGGGQEAREITAYNPARRTFSLDLTWKFNEASSKYRGSGAGEKQKARM